ncbi:uncharacterized protein LOC119646464 [Hermetia illucens]|nr:uncharacterized protein LOC119646464 [Hermetia illucens]
MPEVLSFQPSTFTAHLFQANISEANFVYRVLKMENSLFIYIAEAGFECLNELAVAMPMRNSDEVVATTITGPLLGCDSKELALKISKRLKKQIYLSCNVATDRLVRPLLEKHLVEQIKEHPDWF